MRNQENLEMDLWYLSQMIYYIDTTFERLEFAKRSALSVNDEMVIDSLAMNVGQIGEQLDSEKLSMEVRDKYPDVPWKMIKGFRNLAYHSYGSVDAKMLLGIVTKDLAELREQLEVIIKDLKREIEL